MKVQISSVLPSQFVSFIDKISSAKNHSNRSIFRGGPPALNYYMQYINLTHSLFGNEARLLNFLSLVWHYCFFYLVYFIASLHSLIFLKFKLHF